MTKPEDTTNKHIIIRRIETSGLRRWRSQGPKGDQRIALVWSLETTIYKSVLLLLARLVWHQKYVRGTVKILPT